MIIGIDPGRSGGVAIWSPVAGATFAFGMPPTEIELARLLDTASLTVTAFIEEVPKFTGKLIPSSAAAVLFYNYGLAVGILTALPGIKIVKVTPPVWQKVYGLGTRRQCVSGVEWKNKLKAKAQELYPNLKVTLKTADALLILHYGRHHYQAKP